MPAAGHLLGIDFGSSNTVAVVRWPDGRVRPLLFDGSPLLPSAVYAEPAGALVVGRDAVQSSRLDPARFEPNPKRRIDESTLLLGEREVPLIDVIGAVLARVAEEWRRTVGMVTPQTTLTCPAVWGATRRLMLIDAAARAGFADVRLVAEPVAAATYFAQVLGRDVPIGSVVVVHDLGAGTFDASVVARTSSGFDVLAVDGRDDIGGIDVDAALIGHLQQLYGERDPAAWQRLAAPSTVEERRAKRLLWDDVKAAKERLSRSPSADLVVPLADIEIHLTRAELEKLAAPLLEQTVRVTQGVIRWANLAPGRMAGVFLVGGSSRIPLMATLLHRALGEPPVVLEQPELVVAEGSVHTGALALAASAVAPGPATGVMPRLPLDAFGQVGSPVRRAVPVSPAPVATPPVATPPVATPPVPASPVPALPLSAPPASAPPVAGAPVSAVPVSPGVTVPPAPTPAGPGSSGPTPAGPPPVGPTPVGPTPVGPGSSGPAASGQAPFVPAPAGHAGAPAVERSVGRVIVPGAQPPPGMSPVPAGPVAPTRPMPRLEPTAPRMDAPTMPPQPAFVAPTLPALSYPRPVSTPPAYPQPGYPQSGYPPAPPPAPAQPAYPQPGYSQPAYPRPEHSFVDPAARGVRPRGGLRRFTMRLLTTLLLVAVPLVSAVVAYRVTTGHLPDVGEILDRLR